MAENNVENEIMVGKKSGEKLIWRTIFFGIFFGEFLFVKKHLGIKEQKC